MEQLGGNIFKSSVQNKWAFLGSFSFRTLPASNSEPISLGAVSKFSYNVLVRTSDPDFEVMPPDDTAQ